ncbi:hypothetical protein E2C01_068103 [Portunus trituberculatus]|uniref:Uncharacterized protein n=1 Tax=Portunus trituberculatus TaxID=210409 RepID=A0A5B7HVM6_PORTR|nr:hypothetical protein [Portunus trituberculatus]
MNGTHEAATNPPSISRGCQNNGPRGKGSQQRQHLRNNATPPCLRSSSTSREHTHAGEHRVITHGRCHAVFILCWPAWVLVWVLLASHISYLHFGLSYA